MSNEATTFHLADLLCPRCGEFLGNDRHDTALEDGMTVTCNAREPEPWELDDRFGPKTNVALNIMNQCLSDMGRRLTVAQHSRVMRRIEETIAVALAEAGK